MTTQGVLRGLNLSTVLHMVEIDQLTCTLHVRSGENLGLLYFRGGMLLDAESGPKSGIDAAYEIVNWAGDGETDIEIREECEAEERTIDLPVTRLLLEGLARGDEERHEQSLAPVNGLGRDGGLGRERPASLPSELADLLAVPDLAAAKIAEAEKAESPAGASVDEATAGETSAGEVSAGQSDSDDLEVSDDLDDEDKEDGVSKLQSVLDRFREEVPEFVATDIVSIDSGLSIGGTTLDPDFDSSLASASYAEVVKSNRTALDLLGLGADSTEDILVSTEKALILIRMLGGEYFHVLAITRRGNLGFARAIMKKYEGSMLQAVGQLA